MSATPRSNESADPANLPPSAASDPAASPIPPVVPPGALTPEEQMEKFAQELKETDWGHQPC